MAIVSERLNPKPMPSTPQPDVKGSRSSSTNPLAGQMSGLNLGNEPSKEESGFFTSFWSSKKSKKPGQLEPVRLFFEIGAKLMRVASSSSKTVWQPF
jgi:hypothetical protein